MSKEENNRIIDDFFDEISPEELEQTRISLDIAMRLHDILDEKGMSQKDLAKLMGKKESEISRWLKGMHNFTMKSIAKLQVALGENILSVPKQKATSTLSREGMIEIQELDRTPKLIKLRIVPSKGKNSGELKVA